MGKSKHSNFFSRSHMQLFLQSTPCLNSPAKYRADFFASSLNETEVFKYGNKYVGKMWSKIDSVKGCRITSIGICNH